MSTALRDAKKKPGVRSDFPLIYAILLSYACAGTERRGVLNVVYEKLHRVPGPVFVCRLHNA